MGNACPGSGLFELTLGRRLNDRYESQNTIWPQSQFGSFSGGLVQWLHRQHGTDP